MVRKRFSAMSIPTYLHTSFLKELNISGKWKKKQCWKKICNMPGWRLKTAVSRLLKNIFFSFFLQMSWFFKNNFVTPTVIDSIPPLLLYCSPSPPQNFSWLQTITKYSEKESNKNPRFVFIKSHVTMILIGILLRRLSQCSQPSLPKLSLLTQCGNLSSFSATLDLRIELILRGSKELIGKVSVF